MTLTVEDREEIMNEAHRRYREHYSRVRGQMVTEADSLEYWVIGATINKVMERLNDT